MENVTKITSQLENVMASVVQEKEARRAARHSSSSSSSGSRATSAQVSTSSSLVNINALSGHAGGANGTSQLSISTDEKFAAKTRVGPKQLHRIMQLQMQAFMSITANVADLHHTVTDMRLAFLAGMCACVFISVCGCISPFVYLCVYVSLIHTRTNPTHTSLSPTNHRIECIEQSRQ